MDGQEAFPVFGFMCMFPGTQCRTFISVSGVLDRKKVKNYYKFSRHKRRVRWSRLYSLAFVILSASLCLPRTWTQT